MSFLRYPVLLVHGMGFRDIKLFNYWGRIPKLLTDMGIQVFYGEQDSVADIETNGIHLAGRIEQILKETGAEKVNIIAHSKGGLDTRYCISHMNMSGRVASLTTLATPHNGSKTVDLLMKLPDFLVRFVAFWADFWYRRFGDRKPDCYRVFHCFTTRQAEAFNSSTPDAEGVYYQSYAFVMKNAFSDFALTVPYLLVKWIEGENDGLLTPASMKWGNFRGILRTAKRRGVSHLDEIDFRRKPLCSEKGDGVSEILDVYRDIAIDLQSRGF